MAAVMKEFEHLKIHLEELKRATDSFRSKVIGTGGFGKVYQGEVSHSKGRSMVAIKRLSREFGQGDPEFLKEIMMLSRYTHKNLISLLGFCDEDGEKILVYEHASNGSLDRHLSSSALTWTQRLKICLDVAKGLAYLHDHKGTQQRVLHRDIKSANILLDENWNAKLSDMGLSKLGPANQPHTFLFTNVVGTLGYCDPQYLSTYTLTKESDIYSFGVVLFEVMCGRLCFTRRNSELQNSQLQILVPMWKQNYKHKKLDMIIFRDLMPYADPASLETFSGIAFQCLHNSREQRPTASLLLKKLETALRFQERHDMKLTNVVGTFQKHGYVDKLSTLLSKGKGVFFNKGKKKREGAKEQDVGEPLPRQVHFDGTTFTVEYLLRADAEVMGKSTYGTHYKATLENGDQVAVYRLGDTSTKNLREFEVQLNLVGKIRHMNLLAMRYYYLSPGGEKLIVHDYMPKRSLADILHTAVRPENPRVDCWPARMQIAKGVARGLLCLHAHHNMIHGNLTSHNVWLDENLNPKISDFGLSLSNKNPVPRFLVYRDPELKDDNKANKAADVYSFGMIMLELLTGKSPAEPIGDRNLPQWVALALVEEKEGTYNKVIDHNLMNDASAVDDGELCNSFIVALDCVRPSPSVRPDIRQVLQRLEENRPETTTNYPGGNDNDGAGPSLS